MGGGGQRKLGRRKAGRKKTSFPTLVDVEREAQKEVAARVAARKAAAKLCREANIKRRLLQPQDEVRTTSPAAKPHQLVPDQVQKLSAEHERLQRQQRLAKVRADMMAKSRSAASEARRSGKVEGTGAPALRSLEAGVPTRSTAVDPQYARAHDNEYQGWLKQHGVPDSGRVFCLVSGGKNKVLRQYLLDAGLYENEDPDSPHWDFRWILRRSDVDWHNVKPWQAINSFEPTIDISTTHFVTKKLGLGRALLSSHWVSVNATRFFPQQFDCNDVYDRAAFLRAFVYSAAQAVLRRWANDQEPNGTLARIVASCTVQQLQQLQEAIRVCRLVLHERRWLVDEHGDWQSANDNSDYVEAGQDGCTPDWSEINLELVLGDRDAAAAENCLSETQAAVPAETQIMLLAGTKDSGATGSRRISRAESTSAFKQAMAARTAARAQYLEQQAQIREKKRLARTERFAMVMQPEHDPEAEQHPEHPEIDCCSDQAVITGPANPDDVRTALQETRSILDSLSVCDSQWEILGRANVWVAKPASQSRGRGITVSNSLAKLLKTMGHGLLGDGKIAPKREQMSMVEQMNATTSTDWVVQKYVESPSLIHGKKWDLRMWAVVTSWNPLTVWWYLDGYLRFAVRDFSLEGAALEDAIAHVTNIEFQRESDDLKQIGVDWAQWHTDEYIAWLKKEERSDRRWSQEIQPSMQRIAVDVFKTEAFAQDNPPQVGSNPHFQLYGFDFVVSETGGPGTGRQRKSTVWLMEVNRSPSMEAATKMKGDLCAACTRDLIKVVVQGGAHGTGRFVQVHKGPAVPSTHAVGGATMLSAGSICCRGIAIRDPAAVEIQWFRCLKKTVLRASIARDSDRLGELETGAVVEVVESGYDDEVLRLRTTGGWVSELSSLGTSLMIACAPPNGK